MKPAIFSLRFWPDSRKVAAGFHDGTVKICDHSESKSEVTLSGHTEHVNALGLLPDGQTLVSMSDEILLRDLSSPGKTFSLNPRPTHFYGCSVSPDGRRLAVGAWDGLITIWDLASWQEVATLRGHENRVQALCFLADGNTLVSVGADELCLWRAPSFEETDREALKK